MLSDTILADVRSDLLEIKSEIQQDDYRFTEACKRDKELKMVKEKAKKQDLIVFS